MARRRFTKVVLVAGLVAAFAAAVALGGRARPRSPGAASVMRPTYYQDVRPILEGRCAGCHRVGGIAPFSLRSYHSASLHRQDIVYAVTRRLMPPWLAEPGFQRYRLDPSLTKSQIALIRRWVAQGARAGNAGQKRRALPSTVPPGVSRVDARVPINAAYTPRGSDDFRCFVTRWSPSRRSYIAGFNVRPGQPSEVHHLSVFLVDAAEAAQLERLDAANPGPGYPCFGVDTGDFVLERDAQRVGGWLPGSIGGDFPPGTGLLVEPGRRLVFEIHYNVEHTNPKPDRTVGEIKLASSVRRQFGAITLNGQPNEPIPAGAKDYAYSMTASPSQLPVTGDLDLSRRLLIYGAGLHMHMFGTRGRVELVKPDGRSEVLLSIKHWMFQWQMGYVFKQPLPLAEGDRIRVECHYDNSASNQPVVNGQSHAPRPIEWGGRASNEMCNAFLFLVEP